MKHEDLPERWKERLKVYIKETLKEDRDVLSAYDFHYSVRILFEDKSSAFFNFAFFINDEKLKEVALFTEHCGYHIFTFGSADFYLLEPKWIDTDDDEDESEQ